MKTLTKMAAWVGAATLVAVPSAHAAPVHATDNLNPAATAEVSSSDVSGDITPYIVDGEDALLSEWPWMMRLERHKKVGKKKIKKSSCTGFIISKDVALTAEHCFEPEDKVQKVVAYYGSVEREDPNAKTAILKPGDWKTGGDGDGDGDWAVLRFAEPLDLHPSEHLAISKDGWGDKGPTFEIAGWGMTGKDEDSADVLQKATLDFMPNEKCGKGQEFICSGNWDGSGSVTCDGDSGAPLVKRRGAYPVAVGIHNSSGCGDFGNPPKATKISHFYDRIMKTIDELDGTRPRPGLEP